MAELVDAPASGAGVHMDVEVRVLFWAPDFHLIKTENSLIALGYWRLKICFAQQNAGGGIPDSASRAAGFGINSDDTAFFA